MRSSRVLLGTLLVLIFCAAGWAQTTGSITGTVKDPSGAAIAGATVVVASPERGITREMATNSTGDYNQSGLPAGNYDITVTANGFKKYQARGVKLDVAEKARVDVSLEVGTAATEVIVEGTAVAQVETQSSDLSGTVTGKQITQLQLNNRNYTSLVTLVPGVSSAPGAPDEAAVGISNIYYSINGGRTEYNNWELDGGDNMDNGSNNTLNVYPSLDAIAEFKVLTSNYGAQYGRNGSGTIEVETKSGTKAFHGNAYEFVRNDYFNALNYNDMTSHGGNGQPTPYKKNDFGYTIGGPVFIPGVYNKNKDKTFFFWSQEWRRERAPQSFNTVVPYSAERNGDFSDLCLPQPTADCPIDPRTNALWDGSQGNLPVDPTAAAILPLIPVATNDNPGAASFVFNSTLPTSWREELFKIDHNITSHNRVTFRYIHDSWSTVEGTPIWTGSSFPTTQTFFNGPGISMVARLTSTISPTLLNEFVASYTTDHISFKSQGVFAQPSGFSMGYLFPNGGVGKLPAITLSGGIYDGIFQDPDGLWPEGAYNSNPTYTYRDNVTKIVGRHNLQFGAYLAAAQKNELSSLQLNGALTFDTGSPNSSGNAFADLLLGNINQFSQGSQQIKFYNRYKIFEPYFQDDWRITDRLTLNLGMRFSLMGTYRDRYKRTYNWDPSSYDPATAPFLYDHNGDAPANAPAGAIMTGGTEGALVTDASGQVIGNPYDGLVQCGVGGVPVGCSKGDLFSPAPRVGFAWDPFGNGRTAIRGGYGVFFEHTNGNEANTEGMEGQSTPLIQVATQNNITGYANIGGGGTAAPSFPFSFTSIPKQVVWPYMQQWHLDVQHELPSHIIATLSYVGSKGTHLGRQRDLNQLQPLPASLNPYQAGQAISSSDCDSLNNIGDPTVIGVVNGQPVSGQVAINLQTACQNTADPYRPFYGVSNITRLEDKASSIYHALQFSARRNIGSLSLSVAYTYSHSLDDASDRYSASDFVDSYNIARDRATSNFDQRHLLNVSYVYDLPFFKKPGLVHTALGGWQWSGIVAFSTGIPLNITNGTTYSDNAGVGKGGGGTASYPDLVGNPRANVPPASAVTLSSDVFFQYNPAAFAVPTGLTFGTVTRNSLVAPNRTNFDMALFKHFAIKEQTAFEFRLEAFNVFNHSEWTAPSNLAMKATDMTPSGGFLEVGGAHLARIVQLGAKFIF